MFRKIKAQLFLWTDVLFDSVELVEEYRSGV
jgi:hypothetical protein